MLGLKRGEVKLFEHEKAWETEAQATISRLKEILGDVMIKAEHVGSTAIPSIKAKPIIDIALAAADFESILLYKESLQKAGFYYCPNAQTNVKSQLLFACGSYYDGTGNLQTHFIHVVLENSIDWVNYTNFRDYLNGNAQTAREYEKLKLSLAERFSNENGRYEYLDGKKEFIAFTLRKALVKSYLGKTVRIKMDRPIGSRHPSHREIIYPVNYGYIPGVFGGDGEELDVYLLGVDVPVNEYTAKIVAIVHRHNDVEDKLVAAAEGAFFSKEEIEKNVHFQERYYDTKVEMYCG